MIYSLDRLLIQTTAEACKTLQLERRAVKSSASADTHGQGWEVRDTESNRMIRATLLRRTASGLALEARGGLRLPGSAEAARSRGDSAKPCVIRAPSPLAAGLCSTPHRVQQPARESSGHPSSHRSLP